MLLQFDNRMLVH